MRVTFILLAASLALAGCKGNASHDNDSNVDENLTAANIVSNDVTAIDAVTGDAANMAADVDVNYSNPDFTVGNSSPSQPRRPTKSTPTVAAPAETNSVATPIANGSTNAE